jgi:NAD(P)-dependent dehydrogenase (short-subunit alcohol dehydrogenase family)
MATEADLAETAKQVEDRDRRILTRQADVRDLGQLQAAVADGVSEFGHLDIVCANAGIASVGPAWELSEATWHEMIDVNLTGAWKTVKATVPQMIKQGSRGSIILTSSIAGLVAFANLAHYTAANLAHYTAAKHGVTGWPERTRSMRWPYRGSKRSTSATPCSTSPRTRPAT